MEIVAEYQGKLEYDIFAQLIFTHAHEYGTCLVVVENNNIGIGVLKHLANMNYPNIYYTKKGDNSYIDPTEAEMVSNALPGIVTSTKTRPLLIAKLEEYIRNKVVVVRSKRLVTELDTFVWINGKPQAMKGYHDDLVMALAFACWVRDTALVINQRDLAYKKAMLNAFSKSSSTVSGFGKVRGYSPTNSAHNRNFWQERKMEEVSGEKKKYIVNKWLVIG
jgi:hypothetical protein